MNSLKVNSLKLHTSKRKFHRVFSLYVCLVMILTNQTFLNGQPSGGPYGPLPQNYEIPKGSGTTYYVAPSGKSESAGKDINNPTSIESAIEKAMTNDVIVLHGGIYRTGNLEFNQGITIQPYADEKPILKGTKVATQWRQLTPALWVTSWDTFFPSSPLEWWPRERNGFRTPMHRFNNDMVFVDGRFLQSAGWEGDVDENSFFINYETNQVFIGCNPADHLIEITAYDVCLHRVTGDVHGKKTDKRGPIIKGLTITQYAYRGIEIDGTEPEGISSEADHGKEVIGTTLENCLISFCSRVAAYLRGDNLVVRNCKITDTSTEGLYIIASADVLLERNIFTRNNIENITGYFPAAVKIFNQTHRVTCNDNLIIDLPNSNGVWYDVGNVDGVFTNNWVENVGHSVGERRIDQLWPSENGFFFEISKGAVCAGNVFVNCDHGLMVLNSSSVKMYQNTFINSSACIGRDSRVAEGDVFGWHANTGPDIDKRNDHVFINNLMACEPGYQRPLLFVWQKKNVCNKLKDQQVKQMDYNVFVKNPDELDVPVIIWGPTNNDSCQSVYGSVKDFQKDFPQFSLKSKELQLNNVAFKSFDLGNYQIAQPLFKGSSDAMVLPENILKLLKLQKKDYKPYFGAYPY